MRSSREIGHEAADGKCDVTWFEPSLDSLLKMSVLPPDALMSGASAGKRFGRANAGARGSFDCRKSVSECRVGCGKMLGGVSGELVSGPSGIKWPWADS